ncbi:Uncharacterized conserved protein, DUF58 family, contains vWF domain [Arthrobacter sp. OV608]|nr:Uncharacterized conserved protein, DUF58 family, contains vWF domain [Arthrobacter sp. OV608]
MSQAAARRPLRRLLPPALHPVNLKLRQAADPVVESLFTTTARLRPAWTVLRAKLGLVSQRGWICLAVLAISLTLALALGWRELWASACVLAVLFMTAVGFVLGKARYDVTVDLARRRVVVGEQAVGRLLVRNPGSSTIAPAQVELPVGRGLATFQVPRLGPGEELEELFTVPTQRRAVLQLGPVRSVKSDPLHLLRRTAGLNDPAELYVHPRIVQLANSSTGLLRDLEGLARQTISNDDISFHALRQYAPGDDRRHIHWKSSARTQNLMVRQFEETRRSQLAILLAARPGEYADPDEFELAVSTAGSLGVHALADGKAITLLGPHRATARHTKGQLLDGLSAVELNDRARPLQDQAGTIAAHAPGASIVVLVTGSPVSPEQLSRASSRLPVAAHRLAITVDPNSTLRRRTSGDLTLLTVPTLEDLATALRKGI